MNPLIQSIEQLVALYAASRDASLLPSIATTVLHVLAQAPLADGDRQRLIAAIQQVLQLASTGANGSASPSVFLPGLATTATLPFTFPAPAGAAGLGLGAPAAGGGTLVVPPITLPGFGGAAAGAPAAGGSGGAVVVGAVALPILVIVLQILLLASIELIAATALATALITARSVTLAEVARWFADCIVPRALRLDCINLAQAGLVRELNRIFVPEITAANRTPVGDPTSLIRAYQRVCEALLRLIDDLVDCGLEREGLVAKLAALKQTLLGRFFPPSPNLPLPAGPAIPLSLLESAPNGFRRETLDGNVSGFHRRGGMSFEEFGDDTRENPDLTNEDPRGPVSIEEVDVDPNLALGAFSDGQLALRKDTLRRFIAELSDTLVQIDADIARLRGSPDPLDQDTLGRQLVARDQVARDIRRLTAALRNTLIECRDRARDAGLTDQADAIQRQIPFGESAPRAEFRFGDGVDSVRFECRGTAAVRGF